MTILEAIQEVLRDRTDGFTAKEIYEEIVKRNLYQFGAKHPDQVVNAVIRRHCADLDFPTAAPSKHFVISSNDGKKNKYLLKTDDNMMKIAVQERKTLDKDKLPEEKVMSALDEHIKQIKHLLMETILAYSPSFFEHMVVDLLLKMGYGYDNKSGIVTGTSHDGGIDGIINEDKLGLDLIYIQAKRYSPNNHVGRKEIQAFVGAMISIQKGVFITTSSFTKEAQNYAEEQQLKRIKLIDGHMLLDLMIKYGIGVERVQNFYIYRIDTDYFQD